MFFNVDVLPKFAPQIMGFIYTSGLYLISMFLLSRFIERTFK